MFRNQSAQANRKELSRPTGQRHEYIHQATGARYDVSGWEGSLSIWWEVYHFRGLVGGVFPTYDKIAGKYSTLKEARVRTH